MIDAIIFGGGIAGCATALSLAKRRSTVAVVDRAPFRGERIGETLAPSIRDLLVELGVWNRFVAGEHEPSDGVRSTWGSGRLQSHDFLFHPNGVGWHIDRTRFDRMMVDAAEDTGARLYREARADGIRSNGDGWDVDLRVGARDVRLSARLLVDATGRAACIGRRHGARRLAFDRLIGIARFYRLREHERADDAFTLLEAAPCGWWYSAFLPGKRLVAVFFTDPEFRHGADPAPHTRARIARCAPVSDDIVRPAHSARLDRAAGEGWLAVGDAASAWDPLSSQGIAKALRSGASAAATITENLAGDATALARYAQDAETGFERYLDSYRKHYRRERRWPEGLFWRRRQGVPSAVSPRLDRFPVAGGKGVATTP